MSIERLRGQIIKEFSHAWEINDKAHRVEHFEDVFQCGVVINNNLELGYDPKLILFAAYFHDMFAWSRDNHHAMSFHWMTTTENKLITDNLSISEIALVSWGCYQHRASYKGTFKNSFAELINAADRGIPGDIAGMLDRAIKYRERNCPEMNRRERRDAAIQHLKEKFGSTGYARYPQMYLRVFGAELKKQREEINALR